ncbi:hypothetical protein SNK04_002654 [Fusarium graminearum]
MVSRSILAVAAFAVSFLGAEAGPCRPTTATSLAGSETSSTVISVPESTTLTTLIETTTTAVAEATTTSADEVTTTAEAPVCAETQVIINPGFDDNNSLSPWTGDGTRTTFSVYSEPNAADLEFENGGGSGQFAQNLPTLNGDYVLSYRWSAALAYNLGSGFSCTIQPKIGNDALTAIYPDNLSNWKLESQRWSSRGTALAGAAISFSVSCSGEYDALGIFFDDVTLTRDCGNATPTD